MSNSPTLGLTLMSASQAQKEVVFNEFLIAMDALFRGVVISATLAAPPNSPDEGDTYIVASGATGAWSGQDKKIAFYFNGWQFVAAKDHMRMYDQAATVWRVFRSNSNSWDAEPASTVSVLTDLTNVQGSPTEGQVLTFVAADGKWEPRTAAYPATAITALTDVAVTESDTINGQGLAWDKASGKWKAKPFLSVTPDFVSLPGVEIPTGVSANWVAVYDQPNNALTFTDPTSLITVSRLNQVGDVSYPPGGIGAIPAGASLVWNGAAWAPSSAAPATVGISGILNGPGAMDGNAGKIVRVDSVESAWEYHALKLSELADVGVTEGGSIDNCFLKWDNGRGAWVAQSIGTGALASLADVQVSPGPSQDGWALAWKSADAKWEAKALAAIASSGAWSDIQSKPSFATVATSGQYSDLAGRPSFAAVAVSGAYGDLSGRPNLAAVATSGAYGDLTGRPTLATLPDVDVTEGSGIHGFALTWDQSVGKWLAKALSTGGSTLEALGDVNVSEGAGIDGWVLAWKNSDMKWVAKQLALVAASGAYSDLTGKPAIPTNSSFAVSGLGDVSLSLPSNAQQLTYDDNTSKWRNTNPRYDLSVSITGTMAGGETLLQYVAPVAFKILAGAAGCYAAANIAATSATTITIKKNGSNVGAIAWTASAISGTFTISADIVLAAGDVMQLTAPSSADTTLADVGVTLAGVRV